MRNFQRYHFKSCPHIPQEVKEEFDKLPKRQHAPKDSADYWVKSAKAKGMVDISASDNDGADGDDGDGICFKDEFDCRRHLTPVPTAGRSVAFGTHTSTSECTSSGVDVACRAPPPPSPPPPPPAAASADKRDETDALLDEFLGAATVNQEDAVNVEGPSDTLQPLPAGVFRSPSPSLLPSLSAIASNRPTPIDGNLSEAIADAHEKRLERVQLAHDLVMTSRTLKTMPPSPEQQACGRYPSDESDAFIEDAADGKSDLLRMLGLDLYELFAGCKPSVTERDETDDFVCPDQDSIDYQGGSSSSGHQPVKRKERDRRQRDYAPLSDLGLPSSLSWMVDILISGGNYGGKEGRFRYRSEKEVELDLKLMIDRHDIYLNNTANPGGVVGSDVLIQAPRHLNIPDKLFGREQCVAQIRDAYHQASHSRGKCHAVFVFGDSGVGKSSLIWHVLESYPAIGRRHVVSVKFDELTYSHSISPIFGAFDEYCAKLIATENPTKLQRLCDVMRRAIDLEGTALLLSLIPSLHLLIGGSHCPDTCTRSFENQGFGANFRLRFVVRLFLQTLASWVSEFGTALTMFMDDLQFADHNSYDIVTALLTDTTLSGVLFLGGCRTSGENYAEGSNLAVLLGLLHDAEMIKLTRIHINNIDKKCVNTLVSESIRIIPRLTKALSDIVFLRTNGNPLFVRQLLQSLVTEHRLVYSVSSRRWTWDLESIQSRSIDDNIIDLLMRKINNLSSEVRLALTMASALGSQFSRLVVGLIELDRDEGNLPLSGFLDAAVDEGLLHETETSYQWTHDRVQEAAYSLLGQKEEQIHLLIGLQLRRELLRRELSESLPTSLSSADDLLFLSVDHMCRGISLIQNYDDKIDLAKLCLRAGKKSVVRSSFPSALVYFNAGRRLLNEDDWARNYDLMHDLTNCCAEMEYTAITGNIASMKQHLDDSFAHSRCFDDKIRSYTTMIYSLCANDSPKEAVKVILEVLEMVGENFPSNMNSAVVLNKLLETQHDLEDIPEDSLTSLPVMKDKQKELSMRFLFQLLHSSFMSGMHDLTALVLLRMVRLSLSYGLCRESADAFVWYGHFLCTSTISSCRPDDGVNDGCIMRADIEKGYRYGQVGMALMQRFDPRELSRVSSAFYGNIAYYKEPFQALIDPLEAAYEASIMVGDVYSAGFCSYFVHQYSLFCGKNLEELLTKMKRTIKSLRELKQMAMLAFQCIDTQCVLNLTDRSMDPAQLNGEYVDLNEMEAKMLWPLLNLAYSYQIWMSYLFGDYEMAVQHAEKRRVVASEHLHGFKTFSRWIRCICMFYDGLACLALLRENSDPQLSRRSKEVIEAMATWAKLSPSNFEHKLELLLAEQAFAERKYDVAATRYGNVVSLAEKRGFINEAALAAECAFIFCQKRGDPVLTEMYRARTVELYEKWGASAKFTRLRDS